MDGAQKRSRLNGGRQKKDKSQFQAESWEMVQYLDGPMPSPVHVHPPHPPHHHPHGHPPHPPHGRGYPGLHSVLAETLEELSATFRDIQTIEAVIHELDVDALPIFTHVSGEGITDAGAFLERFFELEAEERLHIRQHLLSDVIQNAAVVLYPLPPYVTDLLRPVLTRELLFNTAEHVPVHIQREHIPSLDYDNLRQLLNTTSTMHSLVLEGQGIKKILTVRSNAASILELLLNQSLRTIYLHKIPHLPRGEHFVSLDLSQYELEIHAI